MNHTQHSLVHAKSGHREKRQQKSPRRRRGLWEALYRRQWCPSESGHITVHAEYGELVRQRPFDAPVGCPCTAEQLCNAPDLADYFDDACNIPRHGSRTYSIHGGAGKHFRANHVRTATETLSKQYDLASDSVARHNLHACSTFLYTAKRENMSSLLSAMTAPRT